MFWSCVMIEKTTNNNENANQTKWDTNQSVETEKAALGGGTGGRGWTDMKRRTPGLRWTPGPPLRSPPSHMALRPFTSSLGPSRKLSKLLVFNFFEFQCVLDAPPASCCSLFFANLSGELMQKLTVNPSYILKLVINWLSFQTSHWPMRFMLVVKKPASFWSTVRSTFWSFITAIIP